MNNTVSSLLVLVLAAFCWAAEAKQGDGPLSSITPALSSAANVDKVAQSVANAVAKPDEMPKVTSVPPLPSAENWMQDGKAVPAGEVALWQDLFDRIVNRKSFTQPTEVRAVDLDKLELYISKLASSPNDLTDWQKSIASAEWLRLKTYNIARSTAILMSLKKKLDVMQDVFNKKPNSEDLKTKLAALQKDFANFLPRMNSLKLGNLVPHPVGGHFPDYRLIVTKIEVGVRDHIFEDLDKLRNAVSSMWKANNMQTQIDTVAKQSNSAEPDLTTPVVDPTPAKALDNAAKTAPPAPSVPVAPQPAPQLAGPPAPSSLPPSSSSPSQSPSPSSPPSPSISATAPSASPATAPSAPASSASASPAGPRDDKDPASKLEYASKDEYTKTISQTRPAPTPAVGPARKVDANDVIGAGLSDNEIKAYNSDGLDADKRGAARLRAEAFGQQDQLRTGGARPVSASEYRAREQSRAFSNRGW